MIYYRKTLFGRGPKLRAVQARLVIASRFPPFEGIPAATRGFNRALVEPIVGYADMACWKEAMIRIVK